jgi:hypothetical protein
MQYIDVKTDLTQSDVYQLQDNIQVLKGGLEGVTPSTTIEALASAIITSAVDTFTTSPKTLTDTQFIVIGNMATTLVVNLPTAVGIKGKIYIVKNIGAGDISLTPDGTETIDGVNAAVTVEQYGSVTVASDNANWIILSLYSL